VRLRNRLSRQSARAVTGYERLAAEKESVARQSALASCWLLGEGPELQLSGFSTPLHRSREHSALGVLRNGGGKQLMGLLAWVLVEQVQRAGTEHDSWGESLDRSGQRHHEPSQAWQKQTLQLGAA
jgi:hypothetical protein